MRSLWFILMRMVKTSPARMAIGAGFSAVVVVFGAALLGLSGWFITATGIAGAVGAGILFDVFRPSAGIRFLALGRTAGRYGERMVSHDGTLRALARLREDLLAALNRRPARTVEAMRSEVALTRITADVDAMDGVVLRLVVPVLAGAAAHLIAFFVLWALVGWQVAMSVAGGYLPGAAFAIIWLARRTRAPAISAERATQGLRRGLIDALRDRPALIVAGGLPDRVRALLALESRSRRSVAEIDAAERDTRAMLAVLPTIAAAGALVIGDALIAQGRLAAAPAAIGFFVALGLGETLAVLPRGVADLGRMRDCAARIAPLLQVELPSRSGAASHLSQSLSGPILQVPRYGLTVGAGETILLTGPSGAGKTTLLWQIAGLLPPTDQILLRSLDVRCWSEHDLRNRLSMLTQRSALISGSVADNLALAGCADASQMHAALEAVALTEPLAARGGLNLMLGEGGSGLSGGQARRLAIARCILRRPQILLLDEPTEALDETTELVVGGVVGAHATSLAGLRRARKRPAAAPVGADAGRGTVAQS